MSSCKLTSCVCRFLFLKKLCLLTFGVTLFFVFNGLADASPWQDAPPKNSTKKTRVIPSKMSSRIGGEIGWKNEMTDSVFEQAAKEGKSVFWYVPRLMDTFMDRKTEIDRYMMAGPFSWPAIRETIMENSIAVKDAPLGDYRENYDLKPYQFVEPGFLILNSDRSVKFSIDRLTTIHPKWMLRVLETQLGDKEPRSIYHADLESAWSEFAKGNYARAKELAKQVEVASSEKPDAAVEAGLLHGMAVFRMGEHPAADKIWQRTAEAHPDHPLGWKAAAEAQRIGPFSRGFEVHRDLPSEAMTAGTKSVGSAAPKGVYTEAALWQRSIEFLLAMQGSDGGFDDSDYDFGGTDSLPNVRVAVTALAGMALLKSLDQQIDSPLATKAKITDALHRSVQYCLDSKNIATFDRDEILWAYAYRLRLVARCKAAKMEIADVDLEEALNRCIKSLESVQSRRGNWYHEYGNPFVTATALLALDEAKQAGGQVSEEVTNKGVASLSKDRFGNGAYPYGNGRGQKRPGTKKDVAASAGRMPLCELALFNFDAADDKSLDSAIERSFALHKNLDSALKYDNHTSNLAYGGFFFWYDMRARSEAILSVSDEARKAAFKKQHLDLIMALPELDGCFIDSHELGRVYGTSMALISLSNVSK